ncbi:hypothetical protein [Acetobacter persici]|uniref:hypothetical protein n=1 Tax=Acetobacter persici TaxID=1076596 RepID=UPI001BA8E104|nr:hypothetical protein [Acetobacter persici]MBS1017098.1 hypothetical protein [Acetobacter persici]
MTEKATPKRRGRPIISQSIKTQRRKNGWEDRKHLLHIGWQDKEAARRLGLPETSLRRALDGEGPSLPQSVRDWLKDLSQYLTDHPCPRIGPIFPALPDDKKD